MSVTTDTADTHLIDDYKRRVAYLDLFAIEIGEAVALYGNLRRRGKLTGDPEFNQVRLKLAMADAAICGEVYVPKISAEHAINRKPVSLDSKS